MSIMRVKLLIFLISLSKTNLVKAGNGGSQDAESDPRVVDIHDSTDKGGNMCFDNDNCGLDFDFGTLTKVDMDWDKFKNLPIGMIKEDRYKPGTFYFTSQTTIKRFVLGQPITSLLGNENPGHRDGPASKAEFTLIESFVQFNQTKMAIADPQNGCIRLYDFVTDNVSTLVGICHSQSTTVSTAKWVYSFEEMKNFTDPQFTSVRSIVFLNKWDKLLIVDTYDSIIIQCQFSSQKTSLLDSQLYRKCPTAYNLVADREEDNIYIKHAHGVSTYNLRSKQVTLLLGNVDDETINNQHSHLLPGPFKLAKIGRLHSFNWLLRDQVLVAISWKDNAIVIIDMQQEEVYSICQGNGNQNKTTSGALDVCKLNKPSAMTVTSSDSILLATRDYLPDHNNSITQIWEIPTQISRCQPHSPTSHGIIKPLETSYYIRESVTVTCDLGYAVNGSQRTTCGQGNNWTDPLPKCIQLTRDDEWTMFPVSGQLAGGTIITLTGLIPDGGVGVYIRGASINSTKKQNELQFKMPQGEQLGDVSVLLRLTETINRTYTYKYLNNPSITDVLSNSTIASGGLYVVFTLTNLRSSQKYDLNVSDQNDACVYQNGPELRCKLHSLQDLNITMRSDVNMTLLSNGVDIFDGREGDLIVYPDPVIDSDTLLTLDAGSNLNITGDNLDLGDDLNDQYKVEIVGDGDIRVDCDIMHITNESMECKPDQNTNLEYGIPYNVQVSIGNFNKTDLKLIYNAETGTINDDEDRPLTGGQISGIIIGILLLIIITIALVLYMLHKKRQPGINSAIELENVTDIWSLIDKQTQQNLGQLLVASEELIITQSEAIGEGNFGKIYLGVLEQNGEQRVVAIKTLKATETSISMVEGFLREALMVHSYKHLNVLETLAISFPTDDFPRVALPLMTNGDLKSLLGQENMQFTIAELLHFAKQIACGMEYLSLNKFVHRDLAARNCLVDAEFTVKIADFGLSKDVYVKEYYRLDDNSSTPLPIKWMALESLQHSGEFTSRSDVWSYGVLVWEICTRGGQPYADVDPWDIKAYLEQGRRLPKPVHVPDHIYTFMMTCWFEDTQARPTFTEIHNYLSSILTADTRQGCMQQTHD